MRKIKLILICLFFFITGNLQAQRKIVIEGDTIVAITPKDLKTINGIIVDFEKTKELVSVKDTLIRLDSLHIKSLELSIKSMEERDRINNNLYKARLKTTRKKSIIYGSVGGAVVGVILGILLTK